MYTEIPGGKVIYYLIKQNSCQNISENEIIYGPYFALCNRKYVDQIKTIF